ncbi:MAG: hypothetical protein JXM73_12005 [Anaerolineae bacterium]|nr:hypothetical protein [Anaerolineae bacterium]
MVYRDRRPVLVAVGLVLLLAGIACAFLGPIELYVFYLFSEGGRFYYEGFHFGSFMFGNIAVQVAGYYLAAAVLVSLGYGHVRLRRWARPLALALLWTWILLGLPLLIVLFFMTVSVKSFSTAGGAAFVVLLALSYFVLPWLGIRFYQGRNVRGTFEAHDQRSSALEARPTAILVICLLDLFFLIALHVPLLYGGLFPLFGTLLGGLDGIYLIDAAVLILGLLLWGAWQQYMWAWWGSAVYYAILAATWLVTFAQTPWADLLAWLQFAPTELEALSGMPLQGYELGVFVGLPMLACLVVILACRRHFGRNPA